MPTENLQTEPAAKKPSFLRDRLITKMQHGWRPAGTVLAVLLALLLTWHVIDGKHGLSAWEHERAQDRALKKEIQRLEQENAGLQQQIQRLQSDPDAIEREAREKLHYARPGDVIYTLPDAPANANR